ncbi:LOW QUALITY PROTEIN: plexin-B1-like [Heterodontus francisci]|uniref:LOW QUALITY PROTEIN: plexin-B1-like n=1 Tax=Heterodontus francisci TaxID=7792 RepID=UPI00355C801A
MSCPAGIALLGLLWTLGARLCCPYPTFTRPGALFNHSAVDPETGELYLGAVDRLYQLTSNLTLVSEGVTGPVNDSRDCIPPISWRSCPQARPTRAHNKLLLVDREGGALLACGSVHQGVCEKRRLGRVAEMLERAPQPGETQYVAADDPGTSTVGVVGRTGGRRALFVGRGYTHRPTDAPISTRRLDGLHPFSNEELGRLAVAGGFAEYDHHFAAAFARLAHVYFLFYRREPRARRGGGGYHTYAARICADDASYYSYVEVPLSCQGAARTYNLAVSAVLNLPRGAVSDPVLFVLFSQGGAPPHHARPADPSALCAYRLRDIDRAIERAREACYSSQTTQQAYIEYNVKSSCTRLPKESPTIFPCGDEHTPSPIASRVPVRAVPLVTTRVQLSAIAVSQSWNNTIIFLGDRLGKLHKVFLKSPTEAEMYRSLTIQAASAVKQDLFLDPLHEHLYVLTSSQVTKVPVAECSQYSDCPSCVAAKDPYCGWCVLEGRCSRKLECVRHRVANHWLWFYDRNGRCLSVQSTIPANLSKEEQAEVTLRLDRMPVLRPGEGFNCSFGAYTARALVAGNLVSCQSPDASTVPANEPGKDHVTVELALRFRDVTVARTDFAFYDCHRVADLRPVSPCRACVTSAWNCNWCLLEHRCTHLVQCRGESVIYNQRDHEAVTKGPDPCPYVERIEGSTLIPVGHERALKLIGWHLDLLEIEETEYHCVLEFKNTPLIIKADIQKDTQHPGMFNITCHTYKFEFSATTMECGISVFVQRRSPFRIDSLDQLNVTLYNCAIGQSDCSRCQVTDAKYGCVWCGAGVPACLYRESCHAPVVQICPLPRIEQIEPTTAPVEGGITLTISGTNLGQRFADIKNAVKVAGLPCVASAAGYQVSTRIVCTVAGSGKELSGWVQVTIGEREPTFANQTFTYQDPQPMSIFPVKGPVAGGTMLTITGSNLLTGSQSDISVSLANLPCNIVGSVEIDQLVCRTSPANQTSEVHVMVIYGQARKLLETALYQYTKNPQITAAEPTSSFFGGGRAIYVQGEDLNVVQHPLLKVWLKPRARRRRNEDRTSQDSTELPQQDSEYSDICNVTSPSRMVCRTPRIPAGAQVAGTGFALDNLVVDFRNVSGGAEFAYWSDPSLRPLNSHDPSAPYKYRPGSVLSVEGEKLDLAMKMEEVIALIGEEACVLKTLTHRNLYCVPPKTQPPARGGARADGGGSFPEFVVLMGNLQFKLGQVQYDTEKQALFTLETKIGLAVGAVLVLLLVGVIILIYRRKSKKAIREYKKVLVQLVNLEISVGDQCRREFTDLMTEMMDLTGDLEGTRIPFLDYRSYAERIFFPGHKESPLGRDLTLPESRRPLVTQGLNQLGNLLNNKTFFLRFVQTLEDQQTFSPRDRAYVASLLTVALHGKLEYFTDIMKTLLTILVDQYVAKNPKLMLRRTETVVEKLLTNWISLCLYTFLKESAGEPLYTLVRAIKHQVDKGPVDEKTGKAKYTLNDNRLLLEDVQYKPLTLNVLMKNGADAPAIPVKVLDVDTVNQAKEKVLDQIHKGMPFSQRPRADTVDLEWRAGVAGHLTLSNEDVTSVVQGQWKRLNTLLHYKVPDGATVALVPRAHTVLTKEPHQGCLVGEKTPMLEDVEEGAVKYWHLVKPIEEPEVVKPRRNSLRERERAKAIPEIYLTRLLSMKGIHQKFVDDAFQIILSASRPVPLAVKYLFDFLDDQAARHGIVDPEIIHIWKTNSLPLRFWLNILKNPHFIFDIQLSDTVDAALSVIAQTFMDSCTTTEHKVGRDSPINKLLYAKEIPRYRQMVEQYYADIRQMASASYQEMNSALTDLSANCVPALNSTVALHELYNYISKYYDQIMIGLEEDAVGQKMQLSYRLQQIAALVENKVTDL